MALAGARLVGMLATAKPEAARAFYQDVLGLRLQSDDQFALVFNANGVTLRIAKVEALAPHPFTSLGWSVADVRGAVGALRDKGVVFERFPGMEQDELGIWIPPGAREGVAWFRDPDGNLLSLSCSS